MSPVRFAFAGFRHGHILGLLAKVKASPLTALVAACEEDAATRASLATAGTVQVTHASFDAMLAEVPCEVIAIGDVYAKRGALACRALAAGKHVILDKPICTSLTELATMEALARAKGLAIGCQLDLRAGATRQTLRRLIQEGAIGEVLTVCFSGQHPLLLGSRPGWYFEKGCHGGTINDIAIHAIDGIPWLTGHEITEVVAARVWNGKTPQFPWFQDCAQLMLKLDNGGGVLGDVSYLNPDRCGYAVRSYWRITVHGSRGLAEIQTGEDTVLVASHDDTAPRAIPAQTLRQEDYFDDFLNEVRGEPAKAELTTARVLHSSRQTLQTQKAAETGQTGVRVGRGT
jgi:predicted dehydrogenase